MLLISDELWLIISVAFVILLEAFRVRALYIYIYHNLRCCLFLKRSVVKQTQITSRIVTCDNVIIMFSRRKDCQHVLWVKKEIFGFHGENKIYINRSLCQYYRKLWSKSKKLHSMGRVHSFYVAGKSTKIKVHENSTLLAIAHANDFKYHFLDVNSSPTSISNSGS